MTIAGRIKAIQKMTVSQLQNEYREVYGEKTSAGNKAFLVKKIAWRIQELEYGGVSDEVKQKALKIAEKLSLSDMISSGKSDRATNQRRKIQNNNRDKRLPPPGTIITREYKDRLIQVQILEDGFEYEDCKYRSLSAVAKAVTCSHCNGFLFFQLGDKS